MLHADVSRRPPVASPELRPTFPRWKRSLDLACGVVALPFLGGATLAGAIVISLTSPGPLLFRTTVAGENGRSFGMYRFRTLHTAAPGSKDRAAQSGALPYVPGGERVRRSGWAKLPQIINVLRGEMTIVGAQPVDRVTGDANRPPQRAMRPGIIQSGLNPIGANEAGTAAVDTTMTGEMRVIVRSVIAGISAMLGSS